MTANFLITVEITGMVLVSMQELAEPKNIC